MARNLTEKQQAFLDALFGDAKGDPKEAMRIAGYSESLTVSTVVGALQEEISERTRDFLGIHSLKAAYGLMDIIDNPTNLGNKEKLAAIKDLLDRTGHKATDKMEVKSESPLFILPEKKSSDEG